MEKRKSKERAGMEKIDNVCFVCVDKVRDRSKCL